MTGVNLQTTIWTKIDFVINVFGMFGSCTGFGDMDC